MSPARILFRLGGSAIAAVLLAACARSALIDDQLSAGGPPVTEFTIDDSAVTLTARFDSNPGSDGPFIVEWRFPDGRTYLRKPVRPGGAGADAIETSMPIRGKAPARHPGVWHVRLTRGGDTLVERSFSIREPLETAQSAAQGFASLAYCGPSRWEDPVITGRRAAAMAAAVPGAWIGGEVLDAAGATYSTAVLLTGCAPG